MTQSIFTALSPNVAGDDLACAFRLLFSTSSSYRGKGQELASFFQSWLQTPYAFPTVSGRTALYALLSSLDLRSDDEVLLQAYTCVAVVDPILWVRAQPVFVDIDPETLNMSPEDLKKKISSKSKVLIIQHTFGLRASFDELLPIARAHGLFVIEDCAHALGAEYHQQRLGTFADAAFFSFGRDKVISSVFGGMITTHNSVIAEKINKCLSDFQKPSFWWIRRQLLHPLLLELVKSTYTFLSFGKILMKCIKSSHLLSKAVYLSEKSGGRPPFLSYHMPDALASLALHQLKKLDQMNSHRQSIAKLYHEHLSSIFKTQTYSHEHIYLRYTLFSPHARIICKNALREHIFLGNWYTRAVAPEGVDYKKIRYDPRSCPDAEKAAKQSFNLPTHQGIDTALALRIIRFLQTQI